MHAFVHSNPTSTIYFIYILHTLIFRNRYLSKMLSECTFTTVNKRDDDCLGCSVSIGIASTEGSDDRNLTASVRWSRPGNFISSLKKCERSTVLND